MKTIIKDLKMSVTISRIFGGDEKTIELSIRDEKSRIPFVSVRMSLEEFAECITGRAGCEGIGEVRNLEVVGKVLEVDEIKFPIPNNIDYSEERKVAAKYADDFLEKNRKGEGWVPDYYFDSQNSFYTIDNQQYARTSIRRWVDKKQSWRRRDGVVFRIGDIVTLKNKKTKAKILSIYDDIEGGVCLDRDLNGNKSWNIQDLTKVEEK